MNSAQANRKVAGFFSCHRHYFLAIAVAKCAPSAHSVYLVIYQSRECGMGGGGEVREEAMINTMCSAGPLREAGVSSILSASLGH